jgi:hypothetical protein
MGARIELTARDGAIVRGLARFGAARSVDLVRLFFSGIRHDTALARLRRLYDAGWVEARSTDRAQPNLYTLGKLGRTWIRSQGLEAARVPRGDLTHHLLIVRFWTGIAALCHTRADLRLLKFVPDWDARRGQPGRLLTVVPDARVEIARAGVDRLHFALEVDRGGERAREWRRKLERYASSPLFGEVPVGLLVLSTGLERRRATLEQIIAAIWSGWVVVADANEDPAQLFERLLEYTTTPRTPSPCGKGSGEDVTPSAALTSSETDVDPLAVRARDRRDARLLRTTMPSHAQARGTGDERRGAAPHRAAGG